ncbi:MAG: hypothetical protein QOH46_2669, partial [Solirubrobacteraceae bacterium]|nr:hypothetical protein [Solirubrobacteraceae bacterium]
VLVLAVAAMVFAVVGPGDGAASGQPVPDADAAGARYRLDRPSAERDRAPLLDDAARNAGFRFRAGTTVVHRDAFVGAVARARPEARRLIALVDGVTDVRLEPTDGDAVGLTVAGTKRYDVAIDIDRAGRTHGRRGVDRVVLHELGHVVDSALVSDATMAPLQAAIPTPAECGSACVSAPERFAETFARWATRHAATDLSAGYDVALPTPTLDAWGAQLAGVGAPGYSSPGL